ncbi:putative ribokinase [uncultured Eubacteriales bacterium]|uniref:Ribokinase n=1 Tax=uncultured Eubacteriales bacterium TaxID=172733 RepID=A0A212KGJ4_9FIRM|nr:putative ribokinase [uncultured Eubacteriales bacterium]
MKVLNFGSLNVDYVYQVDHMVRGGETHKAKSREAFAGGKGLNQSVALARAGVPVHHAGLIGDDGQMLLDICLENGIRTEFIKEVAGPGGHTIIQVDKNAQNSILLFDGSNGKVTEAFVDEVLASFEKGDLFLLQNEVNLLPYMIDKAYEKGMVIALNPSPISEELKECSLSKVSVFLMNEIEGSAISGESDHEKIMDYMVKTYPDSRTVLTLGSEGSCYCDISRRLHQAAFRVDAVDTTAAGDTFTGYFLFGLLKKLPWEQTLELAAKAAAIAVTRKGAVPSIPYWREVRGFSGA